MKRIVPDYYDLFACIADQCRHSCCIGWEIDIDGETLEKYRSVRGEFGKRLAEGICCEGDTASFRLDDRERCPFLNERGLCDIILNIGEDALSQICTDHPRFRNFFSDREEVGLGLCCEAADRLILGKAEKMRLTETDDDGFEEELSEFETIILDVRRKLFEMAQERKFRLQERMTNISGFTGKDLPRKKMPDWAEFYRNLERLDQSWEDWLNLLQNTDCRESILERFGTVFEQLLVYFIYRHVSAAQDEWELTARTLFAVHAADFIAALCAAHQTKNGACSLDDIVEIARMYSSEIEYSEENLQAILEELMR